MGGPLLLGLWVTVCTGVREGAAQEVGEVFRDCEVCPEMVVVPAGSFMMGSDSTEEGRVDPYESPQHRVVINSAFAVGIYEVTVDEWAACVRAGGCPEDGAPYTKRDSGGRMPVGVEWDHAWQYADWLSRITGHAYRLPSEAEWEYAARAGTRSARYWGDSPNAQCQYANGYDATAHSELDYDFLDMIGCRDGHVREAPVGSFQPNGWGLYDVLGNTAEWVDDCWNRSYDGAPTEGSSWYTGNGKMRGVRGEDAGGEPQDLRSANRAFGQLGLNHYGFRVARSVP